jgi:hypothetical protein
VRVIVDDDGRQDAAKNVAATFISRMFHGTLRYVRICPTYLQPIFCFLIFTLYTCFSRFIFNFHPFFEYCCSTLIQHSLLLFIYFLFLFVLSFICRSEVTYANKKINSATFQRFHCLSLDVKNEIKNGNESGYNSYSSNFVISNTPILSSYGKMKDRDKDFPIYRAGDKKDKDKDKDSKSVVSDKMNVQKALEKYFHTEVL